MSRWPVVCSSWVVVGLALVLMYPDFAIAAGNDCGDSVGCAGSLDDANSGDNQNGDAGADREPPEDKKNS